MGRGVVVIVVAVLLAVPLVWIGGEMHYRNCVDAAKAAHPGTEAQPFGSTGPGKAYAASAISKCSRLPF